MAIASVTEDLLKRSGSGAVTGARTYQRNFQVETDTIFTGPKAVRAAVPVAYKDPYSNGLDEDDPDYEEDTGSFCQSKQETLISNDGCQWNVQVDYAPYDVNSVDGEDPLSVKPKLDWDCGKYDRVVDQDRDGNAIRNAAGDPFDPPVTVPDNRQSLSVTRNETNFDRAVARAYLNRTNSDVFFGWAPGCAKCTVFKGTPQNHPTFGDYHSVEYMIEFDDEGWDKPILNAGLREMVGSDRKAILTKEGQPVTSPVPLAEDGTKLPPDGTPTFLTFNLHEQLPFASFGFPGS